MATGVSICSNALLMLGAQTINSFTDSDNIDRAKLCSNLYPTVRDDLIRAHPWNCCVKRIRLAPNATAPAFGLAYAFQMPSDCIRIMEVTSRNYQIDYKVEGRSILCDEAAIDLRYVFKNQDESTWDSSLVSLATLAMAARLAYSVTQSASMEQSRMQEFQMALRVAKAVDGQEEPPETMGDERLLAARMGGGW
ncbi:hypothetical protein PHLH8_20950 [Pseudomonas sp. Pc102]|uniref:hypothetical protein n=1 Tax=Pseudomonas sp. Pc102 TaxID=2678261 RepID=UPI001BCB4715|nr:hypothetical protein [Pseudomonas sp. Pc102]BBP82453.1 hypothetical protein PHLH8_20950 [Pseudomonas sp. Pc102]